MDLSLSFLFCSIDLYFCLCASTILSWWLWLCRRVWSQAGWFLQFHSSFSKLLWLFKVFFRHKERKFYFDTLSYIRFGIWYNHNRITIRKKTRPNFWFGPEGVCHGHTSERIRAMTILAHLLSTSFSRDHPDPGIEPTSPILADSFFTPEPPGNLLNLLKLATYICVCVQSLSHVQLFATPWSRAHQAPLSMGFSRQERSVLPFPFSRGSSQPREWNCHLLQILHWQANSLPQCHLGYQLHTHSVHWLILPLFWKYRNGSKMSL